MRKDNRIIKCGSSSESSGGGEVAPNNPSPLFTIDEAITKANAMMYLREIGYTITEDGNGFVARKRIADVS